MGFSSPESGFDSPWGHILCANFFRELIARSACVVALDQCVRSDCVVTLTIRPHLDKLGVRPRPVPPFHAFSFSRGDFFKIEWAETGLGRAVCIILHDCNMMQV